jgi:hypothetical protein
VARQARIVVLVALAGSGAVAAQLLGAGEQVPALALLAGAVALGELLVLRLEDGTSVPLSYAVMLVLAAAFSFPEFAGAVALALGVAFVLTSGEEPAARRAETVAVRIVVAAATYGAFRGVGALQDPVETVPNVLGALGAAAVAQLAVDALARAARRLAHSLSWRGRFAWLTVASSGMLMAIGYRGVDGEGDLGLWGPVLFSTPLLAAWYAFERLDSATRAYRQTIESLAMAPEFGGLVTPGHAQRVAALSVAIAHELGFNAAQTNDVEMAALLHHLGQVTMEDPEVAGAPEPSEVASVTGSMLRQIRPLAHAGDIVSGAADTMSPVAAQVLRIASAYDDLTVSAGMRSETAVASLRTEPAYVYDTRVVVALERAVRRVRLPVG